MSQLGLSLALGTTGILFLLLLFRFVINELLLLLQDVELLLVAGLLRVHFELGFIKLPVIRSGASISKNK